MLSIHNKFIDPEQNQNTQKTTGKTRENIITHCAKTPFDIAVNPPYCGGFRDGEIIK